MEWLIEVKNLVYTRVSVFAETEDEALEAFNNGKFHDSVTIDESWPEVLEIYPSISQDNNHGQKG